MHPIVCMATMLLRVHTGLCRKFPIRKKRKVVSAKVNESTTLRDPAAAAEAALSLFHPITAKWFRAVFEAPTAPQVEAGLRLRVESRR